MALWISLIPALIACGGQLEDPERIAADDASIERDASLVAEGGDREEANVVSERSNPQKYRALPFDDRIVGGTAELVAEEPSMEVASATDAVTPATPSAPAAAGSVPPGADALASPTTAPALAPTRSEDASTFLTRRGRQLYYAGKPYTAVGVNAFGMAGCQTGKAYSDQEMDAFFGALRPFGLTRSWAFEAQGIEGVGRMVQWAEKHSQLLILSLADGRGYCGEADGRKGAEGTGKVDAWYKSGYKQRYLPWLKTIVSRFKDSKAIGMWELINEPGDTDDKTMREFFDDAAAHVKAIDPQHLVLSGSQAEYVRGTSDFAYVHGGPDVDVASLHEYDYDYQNSHTIMSPHLEPALDAMRQIDKPVIVGETGIAAGNSSGCTSYTVRRDAMKQKFDRYLADPGVGGVMVWSWVPTEKAGCSLESFPADPLMSLIENYR